VTGLTTLTANGNSITLAQAGNDFGTVAAAFATTVTLMDATSIVLGTTSVTDLIVVAGGAIDDSGNLTIANNGSFQGTDITLGDGAGTVTFGGTLHFDGSGTVSILETGPMLLSGANSAGVLDLASTASIDDGGSATLSVAGATTLGATGGNITFDNDGHAFNTVGVTDGVNVTLRTGTGVTDPDGIVIGGVAISGNLVVTAEQGDIGNNGALVIGGISAFTANGAGSSITVDDAGNDFTGTVEFGGAGLTNVTVTDTSALDLAGADLGGDLSVTAPGITTSGLIDVVGIATFDAQGSSLDLTNNNAGNDFGTLVVANATDVDVVDVDDITLGDISAGGNLDVEAGSITSSGAQDITGTTTILTTAGSATLNGDFVGAVAITSAADVTVTDTAGTLDISLISGSSVTLTAGAVTDAELDGGSLQARGNDDIVAVNLTITANAIGAAADPLEITAPGNVTFNAGTIYADFANEVHFALNVAHLTVTNASIVEITASDIFVDGDFDPGTPATPANIALRARDEIEGGGGTIRAGTLLLDALNTGGGLGESVIGAIDAPILLDMSNGTDYQVPPTTLNGFGFISASNFTGTDFTRIFSDSGNKIFLIANFTDLIASVQGSFITAQIFTIDSSQFRADLNIFGVDGAGILLPLDQCEDEESADCAKQ
jgi:hypothetical protein